VKWGLDPYVTKD